MASPDLLSWILTGKYLDHLPLYRLEQIAARDRVPLPRSNLAEWVGRSAAALQPLAERLRECLLERPVLHADETPVQQLDPGNGKTRRAYLWAYRSNSLDEGPPIVLFAGSERGGRHAAVICSLLITARLSGLDPAVWLKDTLKKLPTWPNSRIDELLPLRQG